MNNAEVFEEKLYNLLLNHLDEKYDIDEYLSLLEQEPDNSMLTYVLSHAYFSLNQKDLAEKYLKKAQAMNTNIDFDENYENLSLVIYYIFSTITSQINPFCEEDFEAELNVENPPLKTFVDVAQKYNKTNDLSNCIRVCNLAYEKFGNKPNVKFAETSALLYSRRLSAGWDGNEERFDLVRHQLKQYAKKPKFSLQKNYGKLYIYPVTQIGDTIFFVRYIKKLQEEYPKLKLFVIVNPSLKTLFEVNGIPVYDHDTLRKSEMDFQQSFEGLPWVFKNSEFPYREGYLKADKNLSDEYKTKYFNNDLRKIGIVWNSSDKDKRSMSILNFEKMFMSYKNTKFYSLQKVLSDEEREYLKIHNVENLGENFRDFNDTAAAISNLDVVVGCDTSVTNLSGAMGVKTIIALPQNADWRWGVYEQTSNWYASVELFRQRVDTCFEEVFERIYKRLEE